MLLLIFLLLAGALMAPIIDHFFKRNTGIILSFLPLAAIVYFLSKITGVIEDETFTASLPWIPLLNIDLNFFLDGLSLLFSLLVVGIGFLILIYTNGYMKGHENTGKFYGFMLFFMASMLGLVLSGHLIGIYLFWELTSISSFLLIGFEHEKKEARSAALQALLVTTFGSLAMLAGFIIIGNIGGSYLLTSLFEKREIITSDSLYTPALILILLGIFTKSAQFPFHFWLPSAMAAPTPVSAYLHSAAMVNAGIYLLFRLNPVIGETILWHDIIVIFGAATMFTGAYFSLTQKDLKRILAYTTVSSLGLMTLLLGTGLLLSVKAAMVYLVVHALYKASLFMVAGIIDKKTGTRDIYQLSGLRKKMPITTVISILVLISMAGLPPMLGYISKEFIYEAKIQAPGIGAFVLILGVITNIFMFAISAIIAYRLFLGKKLLSPKPPEEPGISFLLGPGILAILSFILVISPTKFEFLIEFALAAVKVVHVDIHLTLWHGFTPIFWLSLVTIISGLIVFFTRKYILSFFVKLNSLLFYLELSHIFSLFIDKLLKFAKKNTDVIQHGYHRRYLISVFIVSAVFLWYEFFLHWDPGLLEDISSPSLALTGIIFVSVIAAVITVLTNSKITAIVTMGVIGYGIAAIFFIHGAIDLAINMILTDTFIIVLFVLVVYKLPEFAIFSSRKTRIRDSIVAISVGGFMASLALAISRSSHDNKLSEYFIENSLSRGHGKNVVNVILVDFRALDTLGEVFVLGAAALSVLGLLKFAFNRKKI